MKKTDKQIQEFIDWMGYNYLHFDNEPKQSRDAMRKEITQKLNTIIKSK